jgi:hypothetical protein
MNPKISLQNYFLFTYEKGSGKTDQLSTIAEKLEIWKEDYELMLEIDENNKCNCHSEMHWINKLQCPEKVYKEGYRFKRLYESLVYVVGIGKINKDCFNLYNEYLGFKHNPTQLKKWEQRVGDFSNTNDSLFVNIWGKLDFIYNDSKKVISVEPFLNDNFDFEIHISPDAFQGVLTLYNLLQINYPQGNEYIQM